MLDTTSASGGFDLLYFERARTWYGWKESGTTPCLRPVLGQRHLWSQRCICNDPPFDLDHPRLWTAPQGTVYTFEPYHAVDLVGLRAWLGDDYEVNELPRSMWWPGTTRIYCVSRTPSQAACG